MPADASTSPETRTPRRKRHRRRAWIIAAAVVLVLAAAAIFLPTPLAQYFIGRQLDTLGIQHDGIDTIDIDLLLGEVRAGPVRFRSGEADPGQLGETGFRFSFGALLQGRAFVEAFFLRGVDLYVRRDEDGAIVINGINLTEIGGEKQEPSEPPEDGEEGGLDPGVERFEFSDSRLVFEDVTGGTLAIDVDRLTVDRLLTWTPEAPTSFELQGRVNEIELSVDGTAVPLADPLRLTVNTRLRGVTIERVARFVGETGLARQDGSIDTEVSYDYTIHRDGRAEGTVKGSYSFSGFDIATPEGDTVTLPAASLGVDLAQALQPDGSASARGSLELDAGPVTVSTATGDRAEIGKLVFAFENLDFDKSAKRRETLLDYGPSGGAAAEGRAVSIIQLMIGWVRDLAVDVMSHQFDVTGRPTLKLTDVRMQTAARDALPGQSLRLDEVAVDLGDIASDAVEAGVRSTVALDLSLAGLRFVQDDGGRSAELAAARFTAPKIDASVTKDETLVAFDLETVLEGLSAAEGEGGEAFTLSLDKIRNTLTQLRAQGETGKLPDFTLADTLELDGVRAGLPLGGGARAEVTVGSLRAVVDELTGSGDTAEGKGSLKLSRLTARTKGGAEQRLDIASIDADGLSGGSRTGLEIGALILGKTIAALTLPLPGSGADAEKDAGGTGENPSGSAGGADRSGGADASGHRLKLGKVSLASGSRIDVVDTGFEPPFKAGIVIDELQLGPVDTGAPETRTDARLAATLNERTPVRLEGWASPFGDAPDLDLTARVEALSLPFLSPYVAKAAGVNVESGVLAADAAAKAADGRLSGGIDLRVDELFVAPVSEEEAKRLKASVGLPVGFVVSVLKNRDGVIELGFPLSGTVEDPAVDYSEAINKAIAGTLASVFPTNWFGRSGNEFEIRPATFEPGSVELTEQGREVVDRIGKLLDEKPGIGIRACGRAARADLLALSGISPPPERDGRRSSGSEAQRRQEIPAPGPKEVEALLKLATQRGEVVRSYLQRTHGVDPKRVPECRTAYSIEDGKPPRAEFQF